MKNRKINIIILIIALVMVLYFTLKDNFVGIIGELKRVNVDIFIVAIVIFITSLVFKSLSLHYFIKKQKKDYSFKKAYELTLIGQFLNGITPFQSGGQPFQVYLLKKDGLRISESTSIMIKDFISFQIALILTGVASLFINGRLNIINLKGNLSWLIIIGFLINVMVLVFLLFITYKKTLVLKIVNKLLDTFTKLRIFRRLKTVRQKINEGLNHFYESAIELKKNKNTLIISIMYNFANLLLLYVIPFIIFKSMGVSNINILSSVVLTSFVMLIGNFIPIPGATGGIEYGFIALFSKFKINPLVLPGAMLLWRFVTYFLGMLIGFIALVLKEGVDKKCE